jgi:hypothetical protein
MIASNSATPTRGSPSQSAVTSSTVWSGQPVLVCRSFHPVAFANGMPGRSKRRTTHREPHAGHFSRPPTSRRETPRPASIRACPDRAALPPCTRGWSSSPPAVPNRGARSGGLQHRALRQRVSIMAAQAGVTRRRFARLRRQPRSSARKPTSRPPILQRRSLRSKAAIAANMAAS